ncbi:MAG: 16S rRNA (cytosine(1402)-N(4))-methyltransferase RsmH [Kiloniellaceae bacterium]
MSARATRTTTSRTATSRGNTSHGAGGHTPVLLREVLAALSPRDGGIYVDGTFGAGGYAAALLVAAACRVWGIDRDPDAVARAAPMIQRYEGRLTVIAGRFGDMDRLLDGHGVRAVDGIALDLGISSMQIDQAERGFAFRADGPLDMRMERAGRPSAAEVVNEMPEAELADVLHRFGEERKARRIARAIAAARREKPIARTGQLADIVRAVAAKRGGAPGIDAATRTFQALRIYVNDELGELERGLCAAERLLAPGSRLAVVAFHSLEDRIVKSFLRERALARARGSRHMPDATAQAAAPAPTFRLLFRGTCRPDRAEQDANPRARSARLRAAERTAAPCPSMPPYTGTAPEAGPARGRTP